MGKDTGTYCSRKQELFVPFSGSGKFRHGDTGRPPPDNRSMIEFMAQEARAKAAYARFQELMADLAWGEAEALETAYKFGVDTKQIGKKAVKQWFDRKAIPAYAVFNIASAMGVDAAWLGGSDKIAKEKAIRKGGWFYAERERFERIRSGIEARRPGKRA